MTRNAVVRGTGVGAAYFALPLTETVTVPGSCAGPTAIEAAASTPTAAMRNFHPLPSGRGDREIFIGNPPGRGYYPNRAAMPELSTQAETIESRRHGVVGWDTARTI